MSYDPSMLKRRVQEEVGIVQKGDVLLLRFRPSVAFKDAKLNNRRRIDRTTIGRS